MNTRIRNFVACASLSVLGLAGVAPAAHALDPAQEEDPVAGLICAATAGAAGCTGGAPGAPDEGGGSPDEGGGMPDEGGGMPDEGGGDYGGGGGGDY